MQHALMWQHNHNINFSVCSRKRHKWIIFLSVCILHGWEQADGMHAKGDFSNKRMGERTDFDCLFDGTCTSTDNAHFNRLQRASMWICVCVFAFLKIKFNKDYISLRLLTKCSVVFLCRSLIAPNFLRATWMHFRHFWFTYGLPFIVVSMLFKWSQEHTSANCFVLQNVLSYANSLVSLQNRNINGCSYFFARSIKCVVSDKGRLKNGSF